jgi:hypothetical protein
MPYVLIQDLDRSSPMALAAAGILASPSTPSAISLAEKLADQLRADPVAAAQVKKFLSEERLCDLLDIPHGTELLSTLEELCEKVADLEQEVAQHERTISDLKTT